MHTKRLTQWHPKVISSGAKQDLYGQSLYLAYCCIIFGPSLLQLVNLGPHKEDLYSWFRESILVIIFSIILPYDMKHVIIIKRLANPN